ncbi:hypothetical protein ACLI09_08265 [Flavobacterium sp. RHBU_24]|uniref:hypothetical protein n=1 Tax=Flavobacterium sp. RHBU_24 TaxID=3391185 RepID=UPI003984EB71
MPLLTKKRKRLLFIIISFFIITELVLRWCFGFCNATLYVASPDYEYIAAPNQDGTRFGKHYHINSFSQRSDEPDPGKEKILGLGDSVLYGGSPIDQDSLATTLFTARTGVQMLNVSAGSWAPDNCAAYLKKQGTFGAKAIILVVSGHDAYDTMNFKPVVGVLSSYPEKQSVLAWGELINRYVILRLFKGTFKEENVTQPIKHKGSIFNPGFSELKKIAQKAGIPLIVYLHPVRIEVRKHYNTDDAKEIITWCNQNNIPIVNGLDCGFVISDYRDIIHMEAKGQNKLAEVMQQYCRKEGIVK